jgi:hypothetical protein
VLGDVRRDRLEEVRLAETGAPVDEERVVRLRGRLGHRERGSVGEPVGRPDDERVEGVLRVQALDTPRRRRRLVVQRRGFCGDDAHRSRFLERGGDRRFDEAPVVTLDPLAREIVPRANHELVVRELAAGVSEPLRVGAIVKGLLEPRGDVGP